MSVFWELFIRHMFLVNSFVCFFIHSLHCCDYLFDIVKPTAHHKRSEWSSKQCSVTGWQSQHKASWMTSDQAYEKNNINASYLFSPYLSDSCMRLCTCPNKHFNCMSKEAETVTAVMNFPWYVCKSSKGFSLAGSGKVKIQLCKLTASVWCTGSISIGQEEREKKTEGAFFFFFLHMGTLSYGQQPVSVIQRGPISSTAYMADMQSSPPARSWPTLAESQAGSAEGQQNVTKDVKASRGWMTHSARNGKWSHGGAMCVCKLASPGCHISQQQQ